MATTVYTFGVRADTSEAKKEITELKNLIEGLEKNKSALSPRLNVNDIKKDVEKLKEYMEGKFGSIDFSQIYSSWMKKMQSNPNMFAKELSRTMRGMNLLDQAVKPEDISKLTAASPEEILDLVKKLGGLEGTKATGKPVTKKLQALYDKYPDGIEGLGGSGRGGSGGGFGASEEALNRIGDTLDRIDANVQGITESIRNGTGTLKAASQSAEEYAGSMEKAETAANKMQTAVDKMKQKQQNVKSALEGEKVETNWDWTLQYLNEGKGSTSKKNNNPKTHVSESAPEVSVSTPNAKPIKDVVKAENELRGAVEETTNALREQNNVLQNNNTSAPTTSKKGLTFTKAVEQIGAPKEIAKYLKDPKSMATILKGLDDDSLKGMDIDQILTQFSDDNNDKLNKALNDRMRRAAMYVQQIAAMFPDDWENMFSGFSIFSQGVMGDWENDIGAFFELTNDLVDENGDVDDSQVKGLKITYEQLVEKMQEWADLYNTVRPMLDKGMSKADIDARLDLMKGFTKEDIKNSNLGNSGTIDLYAQKIEETQQRLDQMAELKTLLDQEMEAGRELSDREWNFLNNYQSYVDNGNAIIRNAATKKTALENPEGIREVARQKAEQRQQENQINFGQETLEAAKAQEELAKSVREANSALKEQNDTNKDNIMYHMGNLSASKTKEISYPFGDEFKAWFEGIYDSGRGWGDGTGLYMTRNRDEYAPEIDQKSLENFYAIDTSWLNLYEAHTEEAAQDFYNFIHHIEQLCLQIGTGTEKFDDNLKNIDSESLYMDFQRVFPNIQLSFEQFDDFITNMSTMLADSGLDENGIANAQKLNAFKQKFGSDDIKTRFLKMLGYQGTDLSGTSYGGLQSGNVIFDPLDKKRIIAQGKNIEQVAQEAAQKTAQLSEEAKKNAEDAKQSAEEGRKAVEQAKGNQEKIVSPEGVNQSKASSDVQASVDGAEQAAAETEKEIATVKHSQETLNIFLKQYTQELAQKKQEREALLKEIETIQSGKFDMSQKINPQSGSQYTWNDMAKDQEQSPEDFLKQKLEQDTQRLEAVEQQIVQKHAQVLRVNKENEEVNQLIEQGYEIQEEKKKVKRNKKTGKVDQIKDEIKAEQEDIEEAQQLLDEEKRQAEERFIQTSAQAAERAKAQFEQQKQQAEAILTRLQARLEELQSKEKTTAPAQTKPKSDANPNPPKPDTEKPDLGGNQTANGVQTEGDKAADAAAKLEKLAQIKKEVTEANQKLAQSAQDTSGALNDEGGAGANANKAFDPKPLQDQIDAQKKALDEQKKTIDELKKANEDLTKAQAQASKEREVNLQKENEVFRAAQQTELEQRREAEFNAALAADMQRRVFEEDEKVRKEQEAKAAKQAEERAKKAEEAARIKGEDKDLSKLYDAYRKDYSDILNAKSVQEFDVAVAHLTETERLFWEQRLNKGSGSYAHNADMLKQNDLPEGYEKSSDKQTEVLKQREMAVAEYTANIISELEKQEAAFEKMDTVYKTATNNPNQARKDFIDNSLVDRDQTQKYAYAIDEVTQSLQRMREIVQSMKDGTFDFGNMDALKELLELRQKLPDQMTTAKDADKAYKKSQGEIEADSIKKADQYKTVLSGLEKQIEGIQKSSQKLINPDNAYKAELESAKELLATIQTMIEELNANPLQFMGKDGTKNAKNMQAIIDGFKSGVDDLQDDYQSQKGVQGRINTYFTSYKGAYTSFFREIKDSFKSQALGELQNEIDRTFKTFEESITNLNRATGLTQGEFLDKYLNTRGGKASASQIEQQQKVRNAIAESYRGLITDISDELTKVEDRMTGVFGEGFLDKDYFNKFGKQFTAGLGDASEFQEFQDNAQKARDAFIELQKIQGQMADGKLDLTQLAPDELKARIKDIVGLFAELNKNYQQVVEQSKNFTLADVGDIERQRAQITQFMKSNPGISADARANLQDYFNQLQQGISQADLTKLTDGWHQVADAEQAAGRTGATFMSELQTRFKSLGAYLLSFVSFYRVIGVFKDGINIIHELDDALTEMQKVSDESLSSLREYQKSTFDTANQIGTTAQQLQVSTADYMRLGQSLEEASKSAQAANVLFNVSEFDNVNDATTALIAMSAAYKDAANGIDSINIVDRLNLIGNNYAIATDELATALQDSASALTTSGNDLDQAIALVTSGNLVVQDAQKVGKILLPFDNYIG